MSIWVPLFRPIPRYWLAWNASNWVYQNHDERGDGAEWVMDCGDGVEYRAKATLRRAADVTAPLQFSAFDVEVTGGALAVLWKIYVLVFRGSVTLQDWAANLSAPINFDSPLADLLVGVHAGWHAYLSDRLLQEDLRAAIAGIESDEILLAGHSLGAALAQIVMLFLWREHQTNGSPLHNHEHIANHARCIGFGGPAPFVEMESTNARAKQRRMRARIWMQETCLNFINNNDPVARLPFDPSFALNLASFGLYEWILPANSLTLQLDQYEHFCSHIMLNREQAGFEPYEPAAEVLLERGPIVWSNEHDFRRYKEHMFPKLLKDISAASRPLLQVVNFRPTGNAPDLAGSMEEFRTTLSNLPEDVREGCLKPFKTAFHSVRMVCIQLRDIEAEMNASSIEAEEARRLHKEAHGHLIQVETYIQSAHNSILAEKWEDVS